MLLLVNCIRQLTEPQVFSLAGQVSISGTSDFSGVTVEIFAATAMDTAITNIANQFPMVGVDLSKDQLFDHRLETSAFSTTTDEEGKFVFNDIPDGQYNVVAEKAGYGWQYVLNVDGTTTLPELKLYPERAASGAIDTYTVWPADQHVIVNGNLVIREGATLLIDKGCVVRMAGNYEIQTDGAIQVNGASDDMIWFTANTPSNDPNYTAWRGLDVNGSCIINHARIDFAETGVKTSGADYYINSSVVSKVGSNGILIARESSGTLENNAFFNCTTGLRIEGRSVATIDKSLFVQTSEQPFGVGAVVNASQATIENSIFVRLKLGVTFEFSAFGDFLHNYLSGGETGLYINKATVEQENNILIKSNVMQNCSKAIIEIFNCNSPVIENNNFMQANEGYLISGYAVHWQGEKAVYYPNNYWGVNAEKDILGLMYMADNEINSQPYQIYIEPIVTQPFSDAGPQ